MLADWEHKGSLTTSRAASVSATCRLTTIAETSDR
jgi:hypothetical protein